jgi:hypothetical protein
MAYLQNFVRFDARGDNSRASAVRADRQLLSARVDCAHVGPVGELDELGERACGCARNAGVSIGYKSDLRNDLPARRRSRPFVAVRYNLNLGE